MKVILLFGIYIYLILVTRKTVYSFDLTLLHTNDVHSRIEQMNKYGGTCDPEDSEQGKCYGGVARRYTKVKEIRANYSNVILVDGGDQFQGTLWYNYYRGNATAYFINKLNYTAGAIGNHEFDDGPAVLGLYMQTINFPLIACNVDSSREPLLNGLYKSSVILDVGGEKIAVTGYLTNETAILVPPEYVKNVVFTNEIDCLVNEVKKFQDQGINKIIAIGHSGFLREIEIAKQVPGIDIIVGGHTNTFLYNGDPPSNDVPIGPYPYVVTNDNGDKVYIVQDYAYGKYLGFLQVIFDQQGVVTSATGNPILLDSSIEQDPVILKQVEIWAEPIRSLFETNVGETYVKLEGDRLVCRLAECNLGNLITDAFLYEHLLYPGRNGSWSQTSVALFNSGGIRASLLHGSINFGKVSSVLPFRNEIQSFKMFGKYILELLEHSASQYNLITPQGGFLQMSGLKVTYNINNQVGKRVIRDKVMIRCSNCTIPKFEPLDENAIYGVVSTDFLLDGGDGFAVMRDHSINRIEYGEGNIFIKETLCGLKLFDPYEGSNTTIIAMTGTICADALRIYLEQRSPVITGLEERIIFQNGLTPTRPANSANVLRSPHYYYSIFVMLCNLLLAKL